MADFNCSYEVVRLQLPPAEAAEVPEDLRVLSVPRHADGLYHANDQLKLLVIDDSLLICFGELGLGSHMCVEASDRRVVTHVLGSPRFTFVNSDLNAFNKCVQRVLRYFPMPSLDDYDAVVAALRADIEVVDPVALHPGQDTVWSQFLDDVDMGSYAYDANGGD